MAYTTHCSFSFIYWVLLPGQGNHVSHDEGLAVDELEVEGLEDEGLEDEGLASVSRVVVQVRRAVAELPRRQCNAIWSPSHQCRLHLSHRRVKRLWLSTNP